MTGKQSNPDPDQVAAIMAHDLESSLLVLSMNAELLLREEGPNLNRRQTGHLAEIERTARRMKRVLTSARKMSESRLSVKLRGT